LFQTEQAFQKIESLKRLFDPCSLCPRKCGARRNSGKAGVCGAQKNVRIASWALHRGEEPPISGTKGSGTLFSSYCPMKCVYCQNYPFSQLGNGAEVSIPELIRIFLELQKRGANNLNLVTAAQFTPQIFEAIVLARKEGFTLPVVYNSSGYEDLHVLKLLEGMVDIYLPDIRYSDNSVALKFSGVSDYVERNREAIQEMFRQVGNLELDENGIGKSGLIVRHLVLPGGKAGTRKSLEWLRNSFGTKIFLSVMCQFFPAYKAPQIPELNRKIHLEEYLEVLELVEELGFENIWAQDPFEEGGA